MNRITSYKGTITIRSYQPKDKDALFALWEACKIDSGEVLYDDLLDNILRMPHTKILNAFVDETLYGSLVSAWDGVCGHLHHFSILPSYAQQTYSLSLINYGEAWLRNQGAEQAKLTLPAHDEDLGDKLFQRAGYHTLSKTVFFRDLQAATLQTESSHHFHHKITITITFLEMKKTPNRDYLSPPQDFTNHLTIEKITQPSLPFYRFLYNTVGDPWGWWERKKLSDAVLTNLIQNPEIEIYVLYVHGDPAGFFELDRRTPEVCNLSYFGLMPHFIGKKLGPYFLDYAIKQSWGPKSSPPRKVTVNTCSLDHPSALSLYQRHGFQAYRQSDILIDNPFL